MSSRRSIATFFHQLDMNIYKNYQKRGIIVINDRLYYDPHWNIYICINRSDKFLVIAIVITQ